jgi:hypothetical protein
MSPQLAFCPNRMCHVRMIWESVPIGERDASRPGSLDLICLDADGECTDPVCGLLGVASARMKDRLLRYRDPRPWDTAG